MTLAPDYSRSKRFWHWFLTGRTLGDPRFRYCQSPPHNFQRDAQGRRFFFPEGSTVPMYVYDMRPSLERARRSLNDLRRQGLAPAWDEDPPSPISMVFFAGVIIFALVMLILIH